MPGFDGTGPRGLGPLTGGGRGFCAVPLPPQSEQPMSPTPTNPASQPLLGPWNWLSGLVGLPYQPGRGVAYPFRGQRPGQRPGGGFGGGWGRGRGGRGRRW